MKYFLRALCFFALFLVHSFTFAQATNNEPCTAIAIPIVNTGTVFCNQIDFAMSGASYNGSIGVTNNCVTGTAGTQPDVWFSFIMPASGNVIIHTAFQVSSPNNDASMQVYTAAICSGTVTYVNCDDDSGPGNMPFLSFTGTGGTLYYIRFFQFNALTNGSYNICLTNPNPPLSTSNVGIGITGADSTLDVNGNIKIRGGMRVLGNTKLTTADLGNTSITSASINSLFIPNSLIYDPTGGTAGKVLTSIGSGNVDWKSPTSDSNRNASFLVANITTYVGQNTSFIPTYPNESYDEGNNYTSNLYTVPVDGYYYFETGSLIQVTSNPLNSTIRLIIESVFGPTGYGSNTMIIPAGFTGFFDLQAHAMFKFTAGTTMRVRVFFSGGVVTANFSNLTFRGTRLN
jgi:hypothetical protein